MRQWTTEQHRWAQIQSGVPQGHFGDGKMDVGATTRPDRAANHNPHGTGCAQERPAVKKGCKFSPPSTHRSQQQNTEQVEALSRRYLPDLGLSLHSAM